MAPPSGIPLIASPLTGGVAPFSYSWSFSSRNTPGSFFGGLTVITPTFATATNAQTVSVTAPLSSELLVCSVRCKITDSTGGVSNPATNLVTYAYFDLFITPLIN